MFDNKLYYSQEVIDKSTLQSHGQASRNERTAFNYVEPDKCLKQSYEDDFKEC